MWGTNAPPPYSPSRCRPISSSELPQRVRRSDSHCTPARVRPDRSVQLAIGTVLRLLTGIRRAAARWRLLAPRLSVPLALIWDMETRYSTRCSRAAVWPMDYRRQTFARARSQSVSYHRVPVVPVFNGRRPQRRRGRNSISRLHADRLGTPRSEERRSHHESRFRGIPHHAGVARAAGARTGPIRSVHSLRPVSAAHGNNPARHRVHVVGDLLYFFFGVLRGNADPLFAS